jgi:hypothetical protein
MSFQEKHYKRAGENINTRGSGRNGRRFNQPGGDCMYDPKRQAVEQTYYVQMSPVICQDPSFLQAIERF